MAATEELGIVLPPGVERPAPVSEGLPTGRGLIVNETELPDYVISEAVETYFEENSSMLGSNSPTTFQNYSQMGGSLLARSKFRVPGSVIEEIILARDLAERDDDIGSAIGAAIALGYGEGLQNTHEDEVVVAMFDEIAKYAKLETRVFPEMHRELLIASQVTTACLFIQKQISFTPMGADRQRTRAIAQPIIGVIPAEQIRVLGNDLFGTAALAYRPFTNQQEMWLQEYFSSRTSPARKFEMRQEDPVLTALLVEEIQYDDYTMMGVGSVYGDPKDPPMHNRFIYRLNPTMVARSCFPKGQWPHPRPLLTRSFPLLEAKRLLNLLDYGLLEGGANFLIVVKKGSDLKPAMPEEIRNLRETIKRASRTGVVVGDHRLDVEIITPDLKELLNPAKRKLIARKLTASMLRIPDFQDSDSGGSAMASSETEILSRVIASDRAILAEHIECNVYEAASDRNGESLQGAASLWFPKIILQGAQFFTDMILKLRDRGDIPRKYGVESAGFNYTAAVQQRRMEKSSGDDRVLTPPPVPFTAQGAGGGLNDNGGGRPPGGSSANGAAGSAPRRSTSDPQRPRQLVSRNQGETVRSMYEADDEDTYWRIGEQTHALMEEYADTLKEGRATPFERTALQRIAMGELDEFSEGTLTIIPVNTADEIGDIKAVRLAPGLSVLVGRRLDDGAVLARALSFKGPQYKALDGEELAVRWGWEPESE